MITKKKQPREIVLSWRCLQTLLAKLRLWRENAPERFPIIDKSGKCIFTTPAKLAQAQIKGRPIRVYYINTHGTKTLLKDVSIVHEFIAYMFLTSDTNCSPFSRQDLGGVAD